MLALPVGVDTVELNPQAARAFDQYVQRTELRQQKELLPAGAFLWVNGLPETRRAESLAQLKRGDVITLRLQTGGAQDGIQTPGALVHHWVGAVFVPGASLQQVLDLVEDYNHHQNYFSPEVSKSKTLSRSGDDFIVYLRLTLKKIITVVLDTEYEVHYEQLSATRAQSRSYSTRIVEIQNAGESQEKAMPSGNDSGFLWRLDSYWRFLEADHGVYVQCEAISLTRDIPVGLHWLIGPFIESIPRESLEFTLRSTRTAVLNQLSQGHK